MRSHYCGQVNEKLVGQEVTVAGWVHRRRDHGGVIFVDLRDREGLLQVVFDPDNRPSLPRPRSCATSSWSRCAGRSRERPAGTANANLASGKVELLARELTTLNRSEPLPFQLDEHVSEEVRLKYPLHRPASREMSEAPAPASQDHARDARLSRRRRLRRHRDAGAHQGHARRRARLSGAVAHASRASSSRCRSRRRSSSSC